MQKGLGQTATLRRHSDAGATHKVVIPANGSRECARDDRFRPVSSAPWLSRIDADAPDSRNVFIPASDARPELMAFVSLEKRGRREGRVPRSHPRPVCIVRKHTVVTTSGAGSSGFPCAMVLTAYFVLPR
jgi:hypothetical protein